MTDPTLANLLADALAHHEATDGLESLVLTDAGVSDHVEGTPIVTRAWLDYDRAGRVAAEVLQELDPPAGWTGPTPLFVLRNLSVVSTPPTIESGAETAVARHGSSTADAANPARDVSGPGSRNLVGRMIGLARQVMPVEAQRHRFLINQMRDCGLRAPTLGSMHELNDTQLQTIITKLEIYGQATHRLTTPEPAA